MFSALRRVSARIGIWPRRIACGVCLVLAAASALSGHGTRPAAASAPSTVRLRPDEVAVPVTVADSAATDYLHTGDHVSLLATDSDPIAGTSSGRARLVAAGVRVLAITRTGGVAADDATLLVAAQHAQALRIAAVETSQITPILETST